MRVERGRSGKTNKTRTGRKGEVVKSELAKQNTQGKTRKYGVRGTCVAVKGGDRASRARATEGTEVKVQ